MTTLSADGLDLLKSFEGLRLDAYADSAGVQTIGYGHTGDVQPGDQITAQQAAQLLAEDTGWAEAAVRDNVDVPLTQDQFDALTSFTYNVGEGAFEGSTLLDKLNAGDYQGAQAEFARWDNAGGQELEGLSRRRHEEAALFGGDAPGNATPTSLESAPDSSPGDAVPSSGGSEQQYTVREGDTLSQIALDNGLSLEALMAANPQIADPDLILPGQQIQLPAQSAVAGDSRLNLQQLLHDALSLGHETQGSTSS